MKHKNYMPEAFRTRLKTERENRNLSHGDLARLIGLERKTIGSYENGDSVPSAITILRLCTAFGVSADYLLGRSQL